MVASFQEDASEQKKNEPCIYVCENERDSETKRERKRDDGSISSNQSHIIGCCCRQAL